MLDKLSSELSNLLPELSRRDDKALLSPLEGLAKPGRFLFELLDKSGIFPRFRDPIVDLIDKMVVTYFNDTGRFMAIYKYCSFFHVMNNSFSQQDRLRFIAMAIHLRSYQLF